VQHSLDACMHASSTAPLIRLMLSTQAVFLLKTLLWGGDLSYTLHLCHDWDCTAPLQLHLVMLRQLSSAYGPGCMLQGHHVVIREVCPGGGKQGVAAGALASHQQWLCVATAATHVCCWLRHCQACQWCSGHGVRPHFPSSSPATQLVLS